MQAGRVLVVDDSPTIRKLVEIAARGTGYSLEFAATGAEGVRLARANPPDVVLLDFVLPDMRGLDVCDQLAADERTSRVPVIIMTAKDPSARELFRGHGAVAGWLSKPFGAADILAHLRTVRAPAPGAFGAASSEAVSASRGGFTRKQKEAAAKVIYGRLRQPLGQIPAWLSQMGAAAPAPFFARKLLTPELMEDLLELLAPVVLEAMAPAAPPAPPQAAAPPADSSPFSGTVSAWPITDLLVLLGGAGRTGRLDLVHGAKRVSAYLRRGEVVLVTSRDPDEYLAGSTLSLAAVPEPALAAARAEQEESGKPLYVTLAECGTLPPCDLAQNLHLAGKRLLLDVVRAKAARFAWHDLDALPSYVEAYGRFVSHAQDTLTFGLGREQGNMPQSLEQLTLVRLRSQSNDLPPLPRDAVYGRVVGFSARVRLFELTAGERRVLTLIDGALAAEDVIARSGLEASEGGRVLHRLAEVGLIERAYASRRAPSSRARPVMILEPDVEGFQRPLAGLLERRVEPVPLVSLGLDDDVLSAIRREQPRLVILNASATGRRLGDIAREVRSRRELDDVALMAVVESGGASEAPSLERQGFKAVLVKPVAYADLERLLEP